MKERFIWLTPSVLPGHVAGTSVAPVFDSARFIGCVLDVATDRKKFLIAGAGALALAAQGPLRVSAATAFTAAGAPTPPLPPPDRAADADIKLVLEQLLSFNEPPLPSLQPEAARNLASFADALQAVLSRQGKPTVEPVAAIHHIAIPGPGGQILLRIYTPSGKGPFPVVLYAHGGGFVIANLDTYDASARGLTNGVGAIVVSVAYREAPEHKFPAAVYDFYAAYEWVLAHAASIGGDPKRVAVAGESAGGNLAAVISLLARGKVRVPVHQLLVYPLTSFRAMPPSIRIYADAFPLNTPQLGYFTELYLRDASDRSNPLASPLSTPSFKGAPPATIINAEIDPLRDDGALYYSALKAAGIPVTRTVYAGVTHEFFGMGGVVAKARTAMGEASHALRVAFGTA